MNTYRAWDKLERRPGDDDGIVDFDVVPDYDNPLSFDSRKQVAGAIEELLDRAPHTGDYAEFSAAKLQASRMHLHLLDRRKVPLRKHAQTAMGVTPEKVDEEVIDDYRARLDDQLKEHGMRFDREYEDALVVREEPVELAKRLVGLTKTAKAVTSPFIPDNAAPAIRPKLVSKDEEWVGAAGTDAHGNLYVKINLHPRHKHTIARLAAIVVHEMQGHIAQFSLWQGKIRAAEMDPAMGITTMHTPENTQAEFNAQAIEQIGLLALAAADPEEGWKYEFQAGYNDLFAMVSHNAHLKLNSAYPESVVASYAADRLPFTSRENIEKSVLSGREDPMLRGYLACYEPAMAAARLLLAQPVKKQKAVLHETFSQPMTLPQIEALITG
ncbi:MAG TPA: hypothetical protein VFH99_04090 [Candidatus Saccharimonadales bacterium]|nr:hypothetical protein [Candidatus Saccharimonadales bacterium]